MLWRWSVWPLARLSDAPVFGPRPPPLAERKLKHRVRAQRRHVAQRRQARVRHRQGSCCRLAVDRLENVTAIGHLFREPKLSADLRAEDSKKLPRCRPYAPWHQ